MREQRASPLLRLVGGSGGSPKANLFALVRWSLLVLRVGRRAFALPAAGGVDTAPEEPLIGSPSIVRPREREATGTAIALADTARPRMKQRACLKDRMLEKNVG